MAQGTVDVIAPKVIIVPDNTGSAQMVSGALFISGGALFVNFSGASPVLITVSGATYYS